MRLANAALALGVPASERATGQDVQRLPSLRDDLDALWGEVSRLLPHDDRIPPEQATPGLRAQLLVARRHSSCSSVASATSISLHDFCVHASSSSTAALSSRQSLRSDASCSITDSGQFNYSLSSLDISAHPVGACQAAGSAVRRSRTTTSLQTRALRVLGAKKLHCACARSFAASLRGGSSSATECYAAAPSPLNPEYPFDGQRSSRPMDSAPETSMPSQPARSDSGGAATAGATPGDKAIATLLRLPLAPLPPAGTATQQRARRLALMAEQSALESSIHSRTFLPSAALTKLSGSRAAGRGLPAATRGDSPSSQSREQSRRASADWQPQPQQRASGDIKRVTSAPGDLTPAPPALSAPAGDPRAASTSDPARQSASPPPSPPRDSPTPDLKCGRPAEPALTPPSQHCRQGKGHVSAADGFPMVAVLSGSGGYKSDSEVPTLDLRPPCGVPGSPAPGLMRGMSGVEHRRWNRLQSASWPIKSGSSPEWLQEVLDAGAPLSDVCVGQTEAAGDAARVCGRPAAAKASMPEPMLGVPSTTGASGGGGWLGSNWIGEPRQSGDFAAFERRLPGVDAHDACTMPDAQATAFTLPALGQRPSQAAPWPAAAPTVTLDTVNSAFAIAIRASAAPGQRVRLGGRFLRPLPSGDASSQRLAASVVAAHPARPAAEGCGMDVGASVSQLEVGPTADGPH